MNEPMNEPKTQTARLLGLQSDMQELYEAAKITTNVSLMHKLASSITSMTKQIKEQELHDGDTIKRSQAIRFGALVGTEFAKMAKVEFGEKAIPLLSDLALRIELIAEAELT